MNRSWLLQCGKCGFSDTRAKRRPSKNQRTPCLCFFSNKRQNLRHTHPHSPLKRDQGLWKVPRTWAYSSIKSAPHFHRPLLTITLWPQQISFTPKLLPTHSVYVKGLEENTHLRFNWQLPLLRNTLCVDPSLRLIAPLYCTTQGGWI